MGTLVNVENQLLKKKIHNRYTKLPTCKGNYDNYNLWQNILTTYNVFNFFTMIITYILFILLQFFKSLKKGD